MRPKASKSLKKPSPKAFKKAGRLGASLRVYPAIQGAKRGWAVAGELYPTQLKAVSRAKELAATGKYDEIIVHRKDGSIARRVRVRPKKQPAPASEQRATARIVYVKGSPIPAEPADGWDFEAELAREYSKRAELMRRLAR